MHNPRPGPTNSLQRLRWPIGARQLLFLAALIPGSIVDALTPEECATVNNAYERLRNSSFVAQRTFELTVNDDLKNREIARLNYSAGNLHTEVLEYEPRSKVFVYENEGKDPILEIKFDCERIEAVIAGLYELTSEDGLEVATLILDGEVGALKLVDWHSEDSARFLFKKYRIRAQAEYSDFQWKKTREQPDSTLTGSSSRVTQPGVVQSPTNQEKHPED